MIWVMGFKYLIALKKADFNDVKTKIEEVPIIYTGIE